MKQKLQGGGGRGRGVGFRVFGEGWTLHQCVRDGVEGPHAVVT